MSILAQPTAGRLVTRAGVRDETPEMARVIETPQMHEFMNQHVIANRVRHQYEPPIEADVTRRRAGSPPRTLIAYADARDMESVMLSQAPQVRGELARGLSPQLRDGVGAIRWGLGGSFQGLRALTLDPRAVLLGKQLGVLAGSPSRKGDTDSSVGAHPDHIASGCGMADEIHERITIVLRHGS